MYYFEIKDLLKKERKALSSFEIFLKLSQQGEANHKNVQNVLLKMYMKCPEVDRRLEQHTPKSKHYVYFITNSNESI